MHDVIRDVAIYIASEKNLITCYTGTNDCEWISTHTSNGIGPQVGSTVFPNLHLLWMENEELEMDDDEFFKGMKELSIFSVVHSSFQQLPQAMRYLENLQTLILDSCRSLKSLSTIGELVNLESFICRGCQLIESLPMEINRLTRLASLEFSDCENLKTIGAGIISNLKSLEELTMDDSFDEWGVEKEGTNASLSELEQLPRLSILKIEIKDCRLASREMPFPSNIIGYNIQIGDVEWYTKKRMVYEKRIELALPGNIRLAEWIYRCVRNAEMLYLEGDCSSLDFRAAQNVTVLVLKRCSTVKKLVDSKTTPTIFPFLQYLELEELSELKEISDTNGQITTNSFKNLKDLKLESLPALEHLNSISIFDKLSFVYVNKCDSLRSLFTIRRHTSLVHLERLEIAECATMEHVFLWDDDEEKQIRLVFKKLKLIRLDNLPRLTSFSKGIETVEFPVLEDIMVWRCPFIGFVSTASSNGSRDDATHLLCEHDKIKFDCLSKLVLYCLNDTRIIRCTRITLALYPTLRDLTIRGFNNLKSLFPLTACGSLSQLEKLEIGDCDMMEHVISCKRQEIRMYKKNVFKLLPKLKVLCLRNLPRIRRIINRLRRIIYPVENIHFILPVEMKIFNCPVLETCVSSTAVQADGRIHLFCKAKKVDLGGIEKLEIGKYDEARENWCPQLLMVEIFSGISELTISDMKGLESLFPPSVARNLHNMKVLFIWKCTAMIRVIEDDADGDETAPKHLLPNLETLRLYYLSKLKCFCECRRPLQFRLLTTLEIFRCGAIEEFSRGPLDTPILRGINGDLIEEVGLNAMLRRKRQKAIGGKIN